MKRKGAIYREGLRAIAEKYNVSLERALEIALEDLRLSNSDEHIAPTKRAFEELRDKRARHQAVCS